MTKKQKKITITSPIIITVILGILLFLNKYQPTTKTTTTPKQIKIKPTPTVTIKTSPSPLPIVYNNSIEWENMYNKMIKEYDKGRNPQTEKTLAYIRKNSPITKNNFIINYSYRHNIYTITLLNSTTQKEVIDWLKNQGVDNHTLNNLQIHWKNE